MARIEVIPARQEHVAPVAERMRAADRAEIAAASGRSPETALQSALDAPGQAWTGLVDGEPVCMFGAASETLLSTVGQPWLLGTDRLVQHQRPFLRRNRVYVAAMNARYPRLVNYVDARNAVSIRWLRWLGFTVHKPEPYGVAELPFHRFEMEAR